MHANATQHEVQRAPCAGGGNFNVPIPGANDEAGGEASFEDELSRQIVAAENSSAWTLMHRFNKAADLLSQLKDVRPL